jgi:hypothetical protein
VIYGEIITACHTEIKLLATQKNEGYGRGKGGEVKNI